MNERVEDRKDVALLIYLFMIFVFRTMTNSQHTFWDQASVKDFHDPFYLDHFQAFIKPNSFIMEYGCGYGRILNFLSQHGYQNLLGFDFSKSMIARGEKENPTLHLQLIDHATIPLENQSLDAAILSTVLCCIPDDTAQTQVINEIYRVLKPGAALYLTDFLITPTEHMQTKYQNDFAAFKTWGIYKTSEGAIVRHFTEEHISALLKNFSQQWYAQENFVTMNNNPVKTFHGIYCKK